MGGLDRIELFAGLAPEDLAEIEAKASWHRFGPEDVVFDKESDTLEVYFVIAGSVRVLSHIGPDQEVALAQVGAGNYFGELAAIDGRERSARVVAIEDSVLASVEGSAFIEVMLRHPTVALRVLERFARIIRGLDSRVTDLSTLSESQRIIGELVRLAKPDPRRGNGFYIPDLPNHKEIASWAGVNRESVAQTIGELARMGVVERRSMSLVVHDWPKLQGMARIGMTENEA